MQDSAVYQSFQRSPEPCVKHSTYFEIYDHLFAPFRGLPITFVEIGILNGGSLFMWRDYFGPQARIIGIDLNPEAKKWEAHGFEIFIGSQSDPDFWQSFREQVPSIDILLDDGGHTYTQQIVTVESLISAVVDGGLLVVEDCHTSYMPGFGDQRRSFMAYCKVWIDKINSRFGKFQAVRRQSDTRVWSVQFFESIVAFRVKNEASNRPSQLVRNKLPQEAAEDFRHQDQELIQEKTGQIGALLRSVFSVYPDET